VPVLKGLHIMKIAIFAAFPQELTSLRRNCRPGARSVDSVFPVFSGIHGRTELIAVETGMQPKNIETAFCHVVDACRPDIILSLGFGGALYFRADIGELVFASRYLFLTREGAIELEKLSLRNDHLRRSLWKGAVAPRLKNRIRLKEGTFLTLSEWIAKTKLKACMPPDVPFPVCDRETYHLAKLSYRNKLPFFSIRSITDTLDEDIPKELFDAVDANGTYRLSRALRLLLSRPSLIPRSLKLGRHAALASRNLWEAVQALSEALEEAIPLRKRPETNYVPQKAPESL
jgi:nucleoside phosphorylase